MPRAKTLTTTTRAWIRTNADGLAGREPHLQQLLMLAQSMDADLRDRGRVQGAHSSAYRAIMQDLEQALDAPTPSKGTGSRAGSDEAGLFGPGAAGGAEVVG